MLFLPVYSMEVYYYYFATMSWFHAPSAMPTDDVLGESTTSEEIPCPDILVHFSQLKTSFQQTFY